MDRVSPRRMGSIPILFKAFDNKDLGKLRFLLFERALRRVLRRCKKPVLVVRLLEEK